MTQVKTERLAEVFVEVADTLVDEFDLLEFLQMLTWHTAELIDGHAAGLLLADQDGRLQLVAASDERAEALELFQVRTLEGPCHDCYRAGTPVTASDLQDVTARWPQFGPRAVSGGYRTVHAFPMRLRNKIIGGIDLFGTVAGDLDPTSTRVVQALADIATIGLLQERAIRRGDVLTQQLQKALNSRVALEQAKGALATIHSITPDEAFGRLRAYSRARNLRIGDVARAVLTDPASVTDLLTPGVGD